MKWLWRGALICLLLLAAGLGMLLWPDPFFTHCATQGRLRLCSDAAFDTVQAQALLTKVEARLRRSPLNDTGTHDIFVSNGPWHTRIFMRGSSAAAFGQYPLTRNIFTRHADIDADMMSHADGGMAAAPRTLVYYLAHEITHTLVGEHLGSAGDWGKKLPQWVREGYPDYVGMGSGGPDDDPLRLYALYRNHDPALTNDATYYRYRMLTAYFLQQRHWSLDRLLATTLSTAQAQALMDQDTVIRSLK